MSKHELISLLLFLLVFSTQGKAESYFLPLVRNWSTADQKAGRQNWDIAQDKDGVMFIANSSCLLEFDGHTWRKHYLPHKLGVRSVAIGNDGKIFVGSFCEFGWFDRLQDGSLEYHSISSICNEGELENDDIWSIVINKKKVYFQSFERLFIYDGSSVKTVNISLLNLFCIDGILYSQLLNGKAVILTEDGEIAEVCNPRASNAVYIASMVPFGDGRILMASSNAGIYIYDPQDKSFKPFKTEFDKDLSDWDINRGIKTKNGDFVFGSSSKGLIALDSKGSLLWQINKDNILQNETVLGLLCDLNGNVWAVLDDGVSIILTQSAFSSYQSKESMIGMVYDILSDGSDMYIATNKGLYILDNKGIREIKNVKGQTWYVNRYDDEIFIGNNFATYCKKDGRISPINSETGSICIKDAYLADNERHLLEGTYVGIRRYDKDPKTGKWAISGIIPECALAKNIEIDADSHIWYEHINRGIFRITLKDNLTDVAEINTFPELTESDGRFNLSKINGRIVLNNGETFFTYDDLQDKIIPYSTLNEIAGHIKGVHQAVRGDGTTYWIVGNEEIAQLDCSNHDYKIIRQIPLSLFDVGSEDRSSVVYDSSSGFTYLCLNNKIVRIDKFSRKGQLAHLTLLETRFSNSRGKYYSLGNPNKITTARGCNTISFILRFPEYNDFGYVLQYRLKGFDDKWKTLGSSELEQTFERLKFRKYRYQARVFDTSGNLMDFIDIPVKILPYWQYSRLMLFLYFAATALICVYIGRKTKKRQIEIITLKDRVDEAKNEKQEIESQLKIKESELANLAIKGISGDSQKLDIFKQNIGHLEEHFFSTLSEKYPNLTSSDLKFCALLHLNLSTKEIASVLNLTTRGVESARYRLRKKFNLSRTDSLTTFIHTIK
jgi:DNA-binding CsgD family transcriptional regulator